MENVGESKYSMDYSYILEFRGGGDYQFINVGLTNSIDG